MKLGNTFFAGARISFFSVRVLIIALISGCVFFDVQAQEKTINKGLEVLRSIDSVNQKASEIIASIDAAYRKIEESQEYKTLIDGQSLTLPYAIVGDEQDKKYAIVLKSVKLDPVRGMHAEIVMKVPVSSDKSLYFMADNVPLSKKGKLQGELNLFLVRTDSFTVGEGYKIIFKGLDNPNKAYSYVTFDCRGFKQININGRLAFSQNALVESSEEKGPKVPLKLDFFINADKLSNMVVQISDVPAFEFARLPGFKCRVDRIVLDKSAISNAPGFELPGWYLDSLSKKVSGLDKSVYGSVLWQGVYLPKISIEIPPRFTEGKSSKEAVIVGADNLIVDHYGITALAYAVNVLQGGDLKGFKYSIDSLRLNVIANTLSRAGFYGGMSLPVCKEDSKLDFGLTISRNMKDDADLEYHGYAAFRTNLNTSAFGLAQIGLERCRLDFLYRDKQFFPKATLQGSLYLALSSKSSDKSVGNLGVEFGDLVISSEGSYIERGPNFYMRVKTGDLSSKLANLPVTIKDPVLKSMNGKQRFGLGLTLGINLTKSGGDSNESSSGFGGDATITIWAERTASSKRWKYDSFEVSEVNIGADLGAVKLKGSLSMFDGDSIYGQGYCGYLSLDIIEKIKVEGAAIFGRKTELEEASVMTITNLLASGEAMDFPSTDEDVQISSGKTMFRYWFVDARVSFMPGIPIGTGIEINSFTGGLYYNMSMVVPDQAASQNTGVRCKTVSGRTYEPEKNVAGLIAGIGLQSMGGGNVFNGDINFGIEFSLSGMGVLRLATWGGVKFVTMSFNPSGLDAVASKLKGGETLGENTKSKTESTQPPSSAVAASWFVQYDVPNKTLIGDFDIYINLADVISGNQGGNKAGRISIYASGTEKKWYLNIGRPIQGQMIGVNVVGLADIGGYFCVGSVLPVPPIAPMPPEIGANIDIDYNLLAMGGGLSLGARLDIRGKPGITLWPCKLRAELRFILLAGFDLLISQSQKEVYCAGFGNRGINRWYATGQAYIYGEATLGVSYDCGVKSGSLDLLSLYIKAYVFAQLPKPTYLKGGVEVGFKVIGKTFKAGFEIEAGEICASNTLENDVNFIEAIDPASESSNVSVSSSVKVYFSNPIEKFTYYIKGGSGNTVYRAQIIKDSIVVRSDKGKIDFDIELNPERTQMVITPVRVLPEKSMITVTAKVVTQYKAGSDWINVNGPAESKTVTFTTGEEQNYIPATDVYYAYPLPDMKNFYINEARSGFVRLSVLPSTAVKLAPGYEFNLGIFEGSNEIDRSRSITYRDKQGEHNFVFDIPTANLEKSKTYSLKIMKSPLPDPSRQSYTQSGNVSAGAIDKGLRDTVILEYRFTTSSSLTFVAKMAQYNTSYAEIFAGITAANLTINKTSSGVKTEPLSDAEIKGYINKGVKATDPLIQFGKIQYTNQSLDDLGNIISGIKSVATSLSNIGTGYATVTSLLSDINDFLKNANLECLLSGGCSQAEKNQFRIPKGKFALPIGYYLPGEDNPTSVYTISIDLDKDLILPQ